MSPKRSNMAKVWSLLSTCGGSSERADVAATYHLSPIWIFCVMVSPLRGKQFRRGRDDPFAVDPQVAPRHAIGSEAALENLPAAPPVDAGNVAGGGNGLG